MSLCAHSMCGSDDCMWATVQCHEWSSSVRISCTCVVWASVQSCGVCTEILIMLIFHRKLRFNNSPAAGDVIGLDAFARRSAAADGVAWVKLRSSTDCVCVKTHPLPACVAFLWESLASSRNRRSTELAGSCCVFSVVVALLSLLASFFEQLLFILSD